MFAKYIKLNKCAYSTTIVTQILDKNYNNEFNNCANLYHKLDISKYNKTPYINFGLSSTESYKYLCNMRYDILKNLINNNWKNFNLYENEIILYRNDKINDLKDKILLLDIEMTEVYRKFSSVNNLEKRDIKINNLHEKQQYLIKKLKNLKEIDIINITTNELILFH